MAVRRQPGVLLAPMVIAVIAVSVAVPGEPASALLLYNRGDILEGEVWRLLTGHWVHLGLPHLLMNLAGLALVWLLWGTVLHSATWLLLTLLIALGQSLLLLTLHPDISWYVGLSGLLHGLFAAGAILSLTRATGIAGAGIVLLVAKIGVETLGGSSGDVIDWLGGAVLSESHLYGALCGAALSVPLAIRRFSREDAHQ